MVAFTHFATIQKPVLAKLQNRDEGNGLRTMRILVVAAPILGVILVIASLFFWSPVIRGIGFSQTIQ